MNPYVTASLAVDFMLERVQFKPTSVMYEVMSPLSFPTFFVHGIAAPDTELSNVVYDEYLSHWQMYNSVCGIGYWFQMFDLMRSMDPRFYLLSWSGFKALLNRINGSYDIMATYSIPMIEPRQEGDVAVIRPVSYLEYSTKLDLPVVDFIRHILQMVLFGFPITVPVVKALRISDVLNKYITRRLAQGAFDAYTRNYRPGTSIFDPHHSLYPSAILRRGLVRIARSVGKFLDVYPGDMPHMKVPKDLHRHIATIHHLGPLSDDVRKLRKLNAFDFNDLKYMRYLRRVLPPNTYTLGANAFNELVSYGTQPSVDTPRKSVWANEKDVSVKSEDEDDEEEEINLGS